MIFNSVEDTLKYVQTLLEKNIEINEHHLKKICSLNNIHMEKIQYVEGSSRRAVLKSIKLLDNNSFSCIYSKASWVNELPSLYQENDFLKRFMFGFQKSHEDIETKIDNIANQFTPAKTEFVEWLSSWVGVSFSKDIDENSQRKVMSDMIRLYKIRGTKQYFIDLIKHLTNVDIRIDDRAKHKVLHHNLTSNISTDYFMNIYIDEVISEDKTQEEQKLSIIRRIFEIEKPINVGFNIIYKDMMPLKNAEKTNNKVFEINTQNDEYYSYDDWKKK
ncbi:MAG: hypothetical protein HRT43_13315 [Campylobacteraceae bacterium]|nr:hypothetical protein [Campylobacteraceae bacterium]